MHHSQYFSCYSIRVEAFLQNSLLTSVVKISTPISIEDSIMWNLVLLQANVL